jgi:hypothetical protein
MPQNSPYNLREIKTKCKLVCTIIENAQRIDDDDDDDDDDDFAEK